MKLNAFGDVCLRTLMLLAARPDEQQTSRELAESAGVPYNHVTKAVVELRRRGAIDVTRGRSGGVRISPTGLRLTVGELLRSLDDQPDIVDCTTGERTCPLIAGCRLRGALQRAREAFYAQLDHLSIQELTSPGGPGITHLQLLPPPAFPAPRADSDSAK